MLMALGSFTLTSCDEDDEIAYTLEGLWRGNMYVSSYYHGQTYMATYTEINFLRDPYQYADGDGTWVDYYSNAPFDNVANHIRWHVNNGVIHVHFLEEGTDISIHDYRLNDNIFRGTIYDGDTQVDFRMEHIYSPNDWNYNWYNSSYWYAKPTKFQSKAKQVELPVRHIGK